MKHILNITLITLLFSCAYDTPSSGQKDTVVIIQAAPQEPTLNSNKSFKDESFTVDTTAPFAIEEYGNIESGNSATDFTGIYTVKLTVSSSSCDTHSKGDTRFETWTIQKQSNTYKLKVQSDTKTITNYTGTTNRSGYIITFDGSYTTLLGDKSEAIITLTTENGKLKGERTLETFDSRAQRCTIIQKINEQ